MPTENQFIHFELFRYQLLPLTRHTTIDMFSEETFHDITSVEELKARKNEIFDHVLSSFPSLHHRQAAINHKVDINSPPWFVVEMNTQKSLQREKQDFEKERIDTWPHVVVIINNLPGVQLIAISRNSKAFNSGYVVAKILQENLDRVLQRHLLTIQVEALFEKSEFWNLIKKYHSRIMSVNFELISPNMANISKGVRTRSRPAQCGYQLTSHRLKVE